MHLSPSPHPLEGCSQYAPLKEFIVACTPKDLNYNSELVEKYPGKVFSFKIHYFLKKIYCIYIKIILPGYYWAINSNVLKLAQGHFVQYHFAGSSPTQENMCTLILATPLTSKGIWGKSFFFLGGEEVEAEGGVLGCQIKETCSNVPEHCWRGQNMCTLCMSFIAWGWSEWQKYYLSWVTGGIAPGHSLKSLSVVQAPFLKWLITEWGPHVLSYKVWQLYPICQILAIQLVFSAAPEGNAISTRAWKQYLMVCEYKKHCAGF